ncbi:MAG: hypothetical protein AB7I18_14470 [Candidatus Berkiella sp.]
MIKEIIDFAKRTIPSLMIHAYHAVKGYFMGEKSAPNAATEFAGSYAKDAAVQLGKVALAAGLTRLVPGSVPAKAIADVTVNLTANGVSAAVSDESVSKTLVKGAIGVANTALMGPLLAVPATMATDCLVDKAVDLYKVGGPTVAWNNYKNGKAYQVIPYCDMGPALDRERLVDDELNMSFVGMRTAACAA